MTKRKRNFRWIKWLIFLVLIVGAVIAVILIKNNIFDSKPKEEKDTSSVVERKDEKEVGQEEGKNEDIREEKAPQYEGESPNVSETLTGMITYADVINDELIVRTNIDQFLQAGTCSMVMSRNGVTYYASTVSIQESVTTSTCDGYKIPVSELPKGDLSIEIDLESEGKSGKITGRVRI